MQYQKGVKGERKKPWTTLYYGIYWGENDFLCYCYDCSRKKENILSQSFSSNQNLWEYFFTLFAVGVCYCGLHLISILKSMDGVQAALAIHGLGIHGFENHK